VLDDAYEEIDREEKVKLGMVVCDPELGGFFFRKRGLVLSDYCSAGYSRQLRGYA
jgi:hypothetical protein